MPDPNRKRIDVNLLIDRFEENPTGFMAAAGGLLYGISKLIDAATSHRNARTYDKEVNRRIRKEDRRTK